MSVPPLASSRWSSLATVYALLTLGVVAVNSSVLLGGYVYDDQILPNHPLLDGWEDVVQAIRYNSGDYLASAQGPGGAKGVTYRPLPMMSFAATQAAFGSIPLVHHLISLAFHLLALLYLILYARRAGRGVLRPDVVAALAVFALHPVGVEAYGWINGRSDAMAGAVLCALVWSLAGARLRVHTLTILVGLGCLCKETFLPASLAVIAANQIGKRCWSRSDFAPWAAWCAGGAVFFALRAQTDVGGSAGIGVSNVLGAAGSAVRISMLACKTLIFPWPEPMLLLASAKASPVGPLEVLAALVATIGLWLVASRRTTAKQTVLAAGALLTILPVGLISNGFWLGFDRYLYMPMCLLCVAYISRKVSATSRARGESHLRVGGLGLLLLYLGWASYSEGEFYASPSTFASAMIQARPTDPTGTLFMIQLAASRGDVARVRALARSIPSRELPATLLHRVAQIKSVAGFHGEAEALLDEGRQRFPADARFSNE